MTAVSGATLVLGISLVPAAPTFAEPDIDTVEAKVDRLYREAEQASERYNDARVELKEVRRELRDLRADQKRQAREVEDVRERVEDSIVNRYQGQGISTVGRVVVSEDPGAFLSQLATMSAFRDMQAQLFEDYSTELEALELREDATEERMKELAELKQKLGEEKATIDKKVAKAEELLAELEAEERAELAARAEAQADTQARPATPTSRSAAPRVPASVPASGRAQAAVQYALAQVGDAYVYGASGPSAFDCSGLTSSAWAAAGVSLPHSSSAQMSSGTPVSSSNLQPGDLVFYYSPVSHVGIYIGNGQIVHAANPSTDVAITGVFSMPYSGAVRPG